MEYSVENQVLTSDDSLKVWEEAVEDAVASAIAERPTTKSSASVYQDTDSKDIEEPTSEVEKEDSADQAWSDESYVGELLIDRKIGPANTFQFCLGLKTTLESEIISIDHSKAGTTIRCTVPNPASLLGVLGQLSGISSWALTPA
jgi:hypothetical protein